MAKRYAGTKILEFIKAGYANGQTNRHIAEALQPLAKENPDEYAHGLHKKWNAQKVSYFAVRHGAGQGKPSHLNKKPRAWVKRKSAPNFIDVEIPARPVPATETYVLLYVPQSKLNTILEVLK